MKFRKKLSGRSNVKWKRGHSSSCNPTITKHRDAAKGRFFQNTNSGGDSGLTAQAVKLHNAKQWSKEVKADRQDNMMTDDDDDAFTAKTRDTFATDFTMCTNMSFNRLLSTFSPDSAYHKEMLAILAAITEVIKANGGKETETEYFAALLTTLDMIDNEESATAAVSLLSMITRTLPLPVLQAKRSEAGKILLHLLTTYANTGNNRLIRGLLLSLKFVLQAQTRDLWGDSSTMHLYNAVLSFITHSNPKVRKMSQYSVSAILNKQFSEGDHHPAAVVTAKYCLSELENHGVSSPTPTLQILTMLKSILPTFPSNMVKRVCEMILKLLTLSNSAVLSSCCMGTLHGMLAAAPQEKAMPTKLNVQLINALFDYQPNNNDAVPIKTWLETIHEAHINLYRLSAVECERFLPRLFSSVVNCWLSESTDVHHHVAQGLQSILRLSGTDGLPTLSLTTLSRLFESLEGGLKYQYHPAWGHVIKTIATFIQVGGVTVSDVVTGCLATLSTLRLREGFAHKHEVDACTGVAIRVLGPRGVLHAIPLEITGDDDDKTFPQSWLLPLLRDNIENTELAHYIDYFLPLAAACRRASETAESKGRVAESKAYTILYTQIWELLPGYCKHPTDIKTSFKRVAKILGTALTAQRELQMIILSSLREIIRNATDEDKLEVGRFSKNFLPILFSLYSVEAGGQDGEGRNEAIIETCRLYLTITDSALCDQLFNKAVSKLSDLSTAEELPVLDLTCAMAPYVPLSSVQHVFDITLPLVNSKEGKKQKSAYRALRTICSGDSATSKEFIKQNLHLLKEHLVTALSSSIPHVKAARLKCLSTLCMQLDADCEEFLLSVIPEAVLCIRSSATARKAAFSLLQELGLAVRRWSPEEGQDEAFKKFLGMVMAGLVGTPHLIASTLVALGHILYTAKDLVGDELSSQLLVNVCSLLPSASRDVVRSALSFIKVYLVVASKHNLNIHLQTLICGVCGMTDDCKRYTRTGIRDIFAKLIRKFGYDIIISVVPKSDQFMVNKLRNIKKRETTSANKRIAEKEEGWEDGDDEEDDEYNLDTGESFDDIMDDLDEDKPSKKKTKKSKAGKYIHETEGEVVDFLDPKAMQAVTVNKGVKSKKEVVNPFKTSNDGRLIITDTETPKQAWREATQDSEDEDMEDLFNTLDLKSGKKRKTKRKSSELDMDDEEPDFKYQAGGSGIHRSTEQVKKKSGPRAGSASVYATKKAGGDVKRKNQPDPYAYVEFNKGMLNKRKGKKRLGQLTGVMNKAKRGANLGRKLKAKNKRKQ